MLAILVEDDPELLAEGLDVPGVVLAGEVAREVGRDAVCDRLGVDADDLRVRGARRSANDYCLHNAGMEMTHFPAVKLFWGWHYYGRHLCSVCVLL